MKTAHKSLLFMTLVGGLTVASAVLAAEGTALSATKYPSIDRLARSAANNSMVVPHGQSSGFQSAPLTTLR